jgi:hypothetical protein
MLHAYRVQSSHLGLVIAEPSATCVVESLSGVPACCLLRLFAQWTTGTYRSSVFFVQNRGKCHLHALSVLARTIKKMTVFFILK